MIYTVKMWVEYFECSNETSGWHYTPKNVQIIHAANREHLKDKVISLHADSKTLTKNKSILNYMIKYTVVDERLENEQKTGKKGW